jgi:anti-anti-sigma regulatory factor
MANNFQINLHRTIDNLYIRLIGDFDGSSALALMDAIKENLNNSKSILIDTGELKKVYPFGQEVFCYNFLKIKNHRGQIRFVGPNAQQIEPT